MSQEHSRTRLKAALLLAAAALFAIVAPTIVLHTLRPARLPAGTATGDTLEIRLVGVRADKGDTVFDPSGNVLETKIGQADRFYTWGQSVFEREYIFEVPETDEPILFDGVITIADSRCPSLHTNVTIHEYLRDGAPPGRFGLSPQMSRRRTLRAFGFRFWGVPVEEVDITLEYYHGARREAPFVFDGPFEPGMTVQSSGSAAGVLQAVQRASESEGWTSEFSFTTNARFANRGRLFAFDHSGKRHCAGMRASSRSAQGHVATWTVEGLPLEAIAFVTVDEPPRSRKFHNVVISYPDKPPLKKPEYRDRAAALLAERTGVLNPDWKSLADWDEKEILAVVDVLRGADIITAARRISSTRRGIDMAALSAENLRRLRTAVTEWSRAEDVSIRAAAVRVAGYAGWEEFFPAALGVLGVATDRARDDVEAGVRLFARDLSAESVRGIAEFYLARADLQRRFFLRGILLESGSDAAAGALVSFAADERPWIWYRSLELDTITAAFGKPAGMSDDLKAKFYIVRKIAPPGEEEDVAARAREMLPALITVRLQREDKEVLNRLMRRLIDECDELTVTRTLVRFLGEVAEQGRPDYSVELAVKTLNRLYGTDFGGLLPDGNYFPVRRAFDWQGIIADVQEWSRTGVDPSTVPADYRARPTDLRVVWKSLVDPEASRIALCPFGATRERRWSSWFLRGKHYLVLRVGISRGEEGERYFGQYDYGIVDRIYTRDLFSVTAARLPFSLSLGRVSEKDGFADKDIPHKNYELWLERADSPTSDLSGTKVFEDWWEKYGPISSEEEGRRDDERDDH
ncbi:MAG: hypothetical protein ACYTAN_16660 [Planctomycetota bacterium]